MLISLSVSEHNEQQYHSHGDHEDGCDGKSHVHPEHVIIGRVLCFTIICRAADSVRSISPNNNISRAIAIVVCFMCICSVSRYISPLNDHMSILIPNAHAGYLSARKCPVQNAHHNDGCVGWICAKHSSILTDLMLRFDHSTEIEEGRLPLPVNAAFIH